MTPNPYRDWLLGIAITLAAVGSLFWVAGFYTSQKSNGLFSDNLAGLGEMALGGGLIQFGLLVFAIWLAVSALLTGVRPATARAAENQNAVAEDVAGPAADAPPATN